MNLCIFGGAKLSLYQAIVCENIRNTFCNFMKFASIKSIHNNSKITAKTHISLALQNRTKQKKNGVVKEHANSCQCEKVLFSPLEIFEHAYFPTCRNLLGHFPRLKHHYHQLCKWT